MTKLVTITLETPVTRGETIIESFQLRKPTAGELRGLMVGPIVQGNVDALISLLPRISMPPLTTAEVEQMEADDFAAISNEVIGFFMTPSMKAMMGMT